MRKANKSSRVHQSYEERIEINKEKQLEKSRKINGANKREKN